MPEDFDTREELCRRLLDNVEYYETLPVRLEAQLSGDEDAAGPIRSVSPQLGAGTARGEVEFGAGPDGQSRYRLTIDLTADEVKVYSVSEGFDAKLGYVEHLRITTENTDDTDP